MKKGFSLLSGVLFISLLASCSEAPTPDKQQAKVVVAETQTTPEPVTETIVAEKTVVASNKVEVVSEAPVVKKETKQIIITPGKFVENTHYEVVKQTATATPEVMEFFSFYCPHCLKFEPLMEQLEKSLGEDVKIKKNHVNFLGKDMGPQLTQALAAAELLEVEKKVSSLIFDQIHTQRKAINGEAGILAIFEKSGISNPEAKGALASFPASGIASQMKRNTETFNIRGVPALIVNGKYQVITNSVKSTDEFIELVTFLTKKKD